MSRVKTDPPSQPNQSLIIGMACFQLVASQGVPLGSREIARRLELEHTRVNRLLGTLAFLGLVSRTEDRKYVPGPAIHILSAQSLHGSGLLAHAIPVLRKIHEPEMVVALGVLWRDSVCYLVHAKPGQDPANAIGAHSPYDVAESVIGHALLAYQEPSAISPFFAARYSSTYLKEIHDAGIVSFHKPNGEISIAAPIFPFEKKSVPIAAVALTGRCTADVEPRIAKLVRDGADAISIALGGALLQEH